MIATLNVQNLTNDERCYDQVRQLCWPEKVSCPHCESEHIIKRGEDETQIHRQRYACKSCHKRFDDLTETVFGMMQRSGKVVIHWCENVKQKAIQPLIEASVEMGSLIDTDEDRIYHRLPNGGWSL